MCGSLLSKLHKSSNRVVPVDETAFTKPKRVRGATKLADETAVCESSPVLKLSSTDLGNKEETDGASVQNVKGDDADTGSLANRAADILQELTLGNEKIAEARAMDSAVAILSAQRFVESCEDKMRAIQNAREILEAQMESGPSSSTTIASQPVNSTRSVLMCETSNSIAFEVLVGHRPTARPSARVPRRLCKLESQPRTTTKQVNSKLLAAEERRLRELEEVRARASSRVGCSRPHPAEAASKATAQKIALKQAAAEKKRNEAIAIKKQSGSKSSRKRNKIATAQASAKEELQSAIGEKMEKAAQRQAKKKQQQDKQKNQRNLREERARKVRENIQRLLREEEKEVLDDLRELEADQQFCASDSDESWGEKDDTVAYEWEDFFTE